jgi:leader peptidase (prepilin peptidase)/N-methyltransferase
MTVNGGPPHLATVPAVLVTFAIIFGTASASAACRRPCTACCAGLVAGLLALAYGPAPTLPVLLLAVPIAARLAEIDLSSLRLPDPLVGTLAAVLGVPLTVGGSGVLRAVTASVLVGLVHLVVAMLPGRVLGLGDVKLAAVLSYALGFAGWPAVIVGVAVPHLINGPVALFLLLSRRAGRGTELPLGPAMLAGAVVAALYSSRS